MLAPMTEIPEDARPALDMLKSVGGDEMVAMMMQTFLQFAEERLGKMVEAANLGNIAEVASIAHSLRSSARQLGALALGDACAATEAAGKAGRKDDALEGVGAIQREFASARPWLKSVAGES